MPEIGRPEKAIERHVEDKLERGAFVRRLAHAVVSPTTKKATGVVIGITGAWGSGKSSVLNLLAEEITALYSDALIVRFDPWLVSGRNDLIAEFLSELIGELRRGQKAAGSFDKLVDTLVSYGQHVAPLTDFVLPGASMVLAAGSKALEKAKEGRQSLSALRRQLIQQLQSANIPIVVLIDEVDRIEDGEIRTIAQLVRSVADFPGISYVLAYDAKRVMQALAGTVRGRAAEERGRSYLEKIVQLQIPLPTTFGDDIVELLNAELRGISKDLGLPENFSDLERYGDLVHLVSTYVLRTPRDVSRIIGTFHALGGMLRGEVDWIDLLAYCGLLVKAPQTAERLRHDPDEFSDQLQTMAATIREAARGKVPVETRLKELIAPSEYGEGTRRLLQYIFPELSAEGSSARVAHPDALHQRRPLLTTLRLGLLKGAYSRSTIEALLRKTPAEIENDLRAAFTAGHLESLIDRLDDIYAQLPSVDHRSFWTGVAAFLRKPDCVWMRSHSPMRSWVRRFAELLNDAVKGNASLKPAAAEVFEHLVASGENELTAHWIRRPFFVYGLFGNERQHSEDEAFLNSAQTDAFARTLATTWKAQHEQGKLLPCRWDVAPLYTMLDVGVWDAKCRELVDQVLASDEAVDGIALLTHGGGYSIADKIVDQICTREKFVARIRERLKADALDTSVRFALRHAIHEVT